MSATTTTYRRALEALRNGVPNADAVRVLGCGQTHVEEAFRELLAKTSDALEAEEQLPGILVAGDFGTGKSHLLEYLEQLSLDTNFAVSRVVISKETPLYDPAKLFRAAAQSAQIPGHVGNGIREAAHRLDPKKAGYAEFYRWACSEDSPVAPLFGASLFLHERLGNDPELVDRVVGFWSGDPISVASVRQGLRETGGLAAFVVRAVPTRQLAVQRFAFATQLMLAAGYSGWVVLIDELELIGRYSLLQRGRSYSELARWMGRVENDQFPGMLTIGAITEDFGPSVLDGKTDRDYVGPKLRTKDTDEYFVYAAQAEVGMRLIDREAMSLVPPGDAELTGLYDRLREIHSGAYGWEAPQLEFSRGGMTTRVRAYVRRWINEWDLLRLYPGIALATEEVDLRPSYSEMHELEVEPESDPATPGAE